MAAVVEGSGDVLVGVPYRRAGEDAVHKPPVGVIPVGQVVEAVGDVVRAAGQAETRDVEGRGVALREAESPSRAAAIAVKPHRAAGCDGERDFAGVDVRANPARVAEHDLECEVPLRPAGRDAGKQFQARAGPGVGRGSDAETGRCRGIAGSYVAVVRGRIQHGGLSVRKLDHDIRVVGRAGTDVGNGEDQVRGLAGFEDAVGVALARVVNPETAVRHVRFGRAGLDDHGFGAGQLIVAGGG